MGLSGKVALLLSVIGFRNVILVQCMPTNLKKELTKSFLYKPIAHNTHDNKLEQTSVPSFKKHKLAQKYNTMVKITEPKPDYSSTLFYSNANLWNPANIFDSDFPDVEYPTETSDLWIHEFPHASSLLERSKKELENYYQQTHSKSKKNNKFHLSSEPPIKLIDSFNTDDMEPIDDISENQQILEKNVNIWNFDENNEHKENIETNTQNCLNKEKSTWKLNKSNTFNKSVDNKNYDSCKNTSFAPLNESSQLKHTSAPTLNAKTMYEVKLSNFATTSSTMLSNEATKNLIAVSQKTTPNYPFLSDIAQTSHSKTIEVTATPKTLKNIDKTYLDPVSSLEPIVSTSTTMFKPSLDASFRSVNEDCIVNVSSSIVTRIPEEDVCDVIPKEELNLQEKAYFDFRRILPSRFIESESRKRNCSNSNKHPVSTISASHFEQKVNAENTSQTTANSDIIKQKDTLPSDSVNIKDLLEVIKDSVLKFCNEQASSKFLEFTANDTIAHPNSTNIKLLDNNLVQVGHQQDLDTESDNHCNLIKLSTEPTYQYSDSLSSIQPTLSDHYKSSTNSKLYLDNPLDKTFNSKMQLLLPHDKSTTIVSTCDKFSTTSLQVFGGGKVISTPMTSTSSYTFQIPETSKVVNAKTISDSTVTSTPNPTLNNDFSDNFSTSTTLSTLSYDPSPLQSYYTESVAFNKSCHQIPIYNEEHNTQKFIPISSTSVPSESNTLTTEVTTFSSPQDRATTYNVISSPYMFTLSLLSNDSNSINKKVFEIKPSFTSPGLSQKGTVTSTPTLTTPVLSSSTQNINKNSSGLMLESSSKIPLTTLSEPSTEVMMLTTPISFHAKTSPMPLSSKSRSIDTTTSIQIAPIIRNSVSTTVPTFDYSSSCTISSPYSSAIQSEPKTLFTKPSSTHTFKKEPFQTTDTIQMHLINTATSQPLKITKPLSINSATNNVKKSLTLSQKPITDLKQIFKITPSSISKCQVTQNSQPSSLILSSTTSQIYYSTENLNNSSTPYKCSTTASPVNLTNAFVSNNSSSSILPVIDIAECSNPKVDSVTAGKVIIKIVHQDESVQKKKVNVDDIAFSFDDENNLIISLPQ